MFLRKNDDDVKYDYERAYQEQLMLTNLLAIAYDFFEAYIKFNVKDSAKFFTSHSLNGRETAQFKGHRVFGEAFSLLSDLKAPKLGESLLLNKMESLFYLLIAELTKDYDDVDSGFRKHSLKLICWHILNFLKILIRKFLDKIH